MRGRGWIAWAVAGGLVLGVGTVPVRAETAEFVRSESFRLLNEGVSAYNQGRYEDAVEKLQRSSSMALNSFRAFYYLGLALMKVRRHVEAVEALDIALDLDPNHLNALVALGDAYLQQGDIAESLAGYYRALKVRPEYPEALDGIGRAYESQADDDEAIKFYRRAIASNPGYAEAYSHLGELYLRQSRFEEAVRLLTEAVSIRPDYAPGQNRLALAYSLLGMFNEAVATIRKAMELEPSEPEHPAALGIIQLELGNLERAEATFVQALALDEAQPLARRGMAEIARRRGAYADALEQVDIAIEDERLPQRRRRGLEAYRDEIVAERDRVEALADEIDSGSADPAVFRELAEIYAGRGQWAAAAQLEERAGPTGIERERLGYLLMRAELYRAAYDVYRELVELDDRAGYAINLGIALAGLGRDDEAVEAYRRALASDAGSSVARLYLGNALLRLGRNEEAADTYIDYLLRSEDSESAERVRRILVQIAPDRVRQNGDRIEILPVAAGGGAGGAGS